jgi:hypothetical protein
MAITMIMAIAPPCVAEADDFTLSVRATVRAGLRRFFKEGISVPDDGLRYQRRCSGSYVFHPLYSCSDGQKLDQSSAKLIDMDLDPDDIICPMAFGVHLDSIQRLLEQW